MGLGLIFGAMSGAGDAAGKSLAETQKFHDEESLMQERASLETEKAKSIATFNNQLGMDTANQQRQAMTDRISGAQNGIINQAMGQKYAGSDAAVAAANAGQTDAPLSDEQQAAIDQSKGIDTQEMQNSSDTYVKAAMKTGDINPKTIASLANKNDAAQMKSESAQSKLETWQKIADDKNKTTIQIADLKAEMQKKKDENGKVDLVSGHKLVDSYRDDIKISQDQIRIATKQLSDMRPSIGNKPNPDYTNLQSQIQSLYVEIKDTQHRRDDMLGQLTGVSKNTFPTSDNLSKPDADQTPYRFNENDLDQETRDFLKKIDPEAYAQGVARFNKSGSLATAQVPANRPPLSSFKK